MSKRWTKKSWTYLFRKMIAGTKLHDIRLNEGFEVGDILHLREYDNEVGDFTGREADFEITYITSNKINCAYSASILKDEYVVLSVRQMADSTRQEISA